MAHSTDTETGTDTDTRTPKRSPVSLLLTLLLPIALIVYSVAFYMNVHDLRLQSRAYPQVVMAVLAVLLIAQIWSDVRDWLRSEVSDGLREVWQRWHRTAFTIIWTFTFIWAMGRVGFYEALVFYVAVLLPLIGIRRPLTVALFTVGTIVGMYLVFDLVLSVRLPPGLLF